MLFRISNRPILVLCVILLGSQLAIFTVFDLHLCQLRGSAKIEEDIAEVHPWGYFKSRNVSDYINPNLVAHIIPEDICASDTFMILMVFTAVRNKKARNAIRATSRRAVLGKKLDVFFLLGETTNASLQHQVMLESQVHGDIIQERFIDSYYNLSLKSVMMLKSAVTYCVNSTKYILKVDDDMYVNVQLLVETLLNRSYNEFLLMGRLISGAKPVRSLTNKWYCPYYMYDKPLYPNFLSGTAYVMSVDVATKLYSATQRTPIFHLEDVYITGICARKADIHIAHNGLFVNGLFSKRRDPCVFKKLLAVHNFSPHRIRAINKALHNPKKRKKC